MIQTAQAKALRRVVSTRLPTSSGLFQIVGFERETPSRRLVETALGIILGDLTEDAPLLRIHSQCFTG
jgi:GTP cyclohydrolase II